MTRHRGAPLGLTALEVRAPPAKFANDHLELGVDNNYLVPPLAEDFAT